MNDNDFSNEISNEDNNSRSTAATIGGYVFLAFFLIMLVLIVISAKSGNTENAVICFGLVFIVTGLIAFFTPKPSIENSPALIFPLVGTCAVVIPLMMKYGGFEFDMTEHTAVIIVSGVFMLIGAGFIIIPTINYAKKKKNYVPITAVCRDLDSHISRSSKGHRTRVYAPKWEYYYNGEIITIQSRTYSNIDVPEIGGEYDLLIDPKNPKKFYRPSMKILIFFLVFGVIWLVISAIALFSMLL